MYVIADTHLGLKERWLGEQWPSWTEYALPLAALLFLLIVLGVRSLELVLVFVVLLLAAAPRFVYRVKQILLQEWPVALRGLSSDAPDALKSFLKWIAALEHKSEEERTIPVYEGGTAGTRTLRPPEHLVLLGDVIELYDAENQNILASTLPIERQLEALSATKIYVTGNHDSQLEPLRLFRAPLGATDVRVVGETFPAPLEVVPGASRWVRTLDVGTRSFLFIHGHQMDNVLRYRLSKSPLMGFMRQFAAGLGDWSLIFVIMTIGAVYVVLSSPSAPALLVLLGSVALWLPRVFLLLARQFWRLAGLRHRPQRARRQFSRWWQDFRKVNDVPQKANLIVVYGHTHALGYVPRESGREMEGYNISSWIHETGKFGRNVMATFLYADEDGPPLVLGWDWTNEIPFHIPFDLIRTVDFAGDWALASPETKASRIRASTREQHLTADWMDRLRDELRWPDKLLAKGEVPTSAEPPTYGAVLKVAWQAIKRFGKEFIWLQVGLLLLVAGGSYYVAPDAVVWGVEVRVLEGRASWMVFFGAITLGLFLAAQISALVEWVKETFE